MLIIIGIALIAGGVWWGFKKGQKMGQERQVVVENFVPAVGDTVGGGHRGNGGGAPGTKDTVGGGHRDNGGGAPGTREDTVGGGHRGNGGGAPGTREVAGAGGNEKPAEIIQAADVHRNDERRVEMQA